MTSSTCCAPVSSKATPPSIPTTNVGCRQEQIRTHRSKYQFAGEYSCIVHVPRMCSSAHRNKSISESTDGAHVYRSPKSDFFFSFQTFGALQ
ncbi:hypothetical protein SCLCIDRAFT_1216585 [Scleroderma citrinum Foug A]|uniref:Uncharacterized protein n=1 Tax=Scleroderma citrinum Foug A TaxID=1036808 RepID=A0A0C2ZG84_9AGAM|nr:hypothetical protein SCLCIDRAFT_1216585 [Scleroderma citrinum Foug A]